MEPTQAAVSSPSTEPSRATPSDVIAGAVRRTNIPALTGLRFFAAIAVYCSHVLAPPDAPAWMRTLFAAGYNGVTLFFVLSGFVLAITYGERLSHPQPRDIAQYVIARVARVYPLYLLVLGWVALDLSTGRNETSGILAHVFALQAWSGDVFAAFGFNPVGWSVSVEFFLYACFPVLVFLLARVRRTGAMVAILFVTMATVFIVAWWFDASGRNTSSLDPAGAHRWLYRMPIMRLGDFVAGIMAARLWTVLRHRRYAHPLGSALALASAASSIAFMASASKLESTWSWDSLYLPGSIGMIAGLSMAPRSGLARLMGWKPIVVLGEASYAFYLIHVVARQSLGGRGWAAEFELVHGVREIAVLLAIIAISVVLHYVIERPARTAIMRLARRS